MDRMQVYLGDLQKNTINKKFQVSNTAPLLPLRIHHFSNLHKNGAFRAGNMSLKYYWVD
ncbi:hypothetical protein DFP86_10983 [Paludibacterium purpuratum]|uniref:Uncharacterized protein n=1 Tax=Paludibacterium purpuratum TaxID=1144873 RepID=A0A4R7B4R8_9NEIS|nr:hypothetical protein DFP86_10983 [Paludibacterium purpuratum]